MEINRYNDTVEDGLTVGPAAIDSAAGRNDQPRKFHMLWCIVSWRSASKDICIVIMSPQQALLVKVENLLCVVGRDLGGKVIRYPMIWFIVWNYLNDIEERRISFGNQYVLHFPMQISLNYQSKRIIPGWYDCDAWGIFCINLSLHDQHSLRTWQRQKEI